MQFKTRAGRPRIQHRWGDDIITMSGFKAKYTFSDSFVDLSKCFLLAICL